MDAYTPKEMTEKAESIGVVKSKREFVSTFVLAILAGAFIALAGCFYTSSVTDNNVGFGLSRILGGASFSVGLILVVVCGAELFTGNTLMSVALIGKKISFGRMLRNWIIVYLGNFVGSLLIAGLVFGAAQWKMDKMVVGVDAYNIAGGKLSLSFGTAFCAGILCNMLVSIAVWAGYSCRTTADKVLAIIFPITAFVALGFEHSVANMYLIPYGMMLSKCGAFLKGAGVHDALKYDPSIFTVSRFLVGNLLPVTLGNIVGGSVLVGAMYRIAYLRGERPKAD